MEKEIKVNGYKLLVGKISPLAPKSVEMQYRKKYPEPNPPTYTVETVDGIKEEVEHTLETIETPEEKMAYVEWKEAHDEWSSGLSYKLLRLFLSQGITFKLTKKQEEDIVTQLEILELDVPSNEVEKNLFYLETFIIQGEEDMKTVIEAVLNKTGISSETLESANATFPD